MDTWRLTICLLSSSPRSRFESLSPYHFPSISAERKYTGWKTYRQMIWNPHQAHPQLNSELVIHRGHLQNVTDIFSGLNRRGLAGDGLHGLVQSSTFWGEDGLPKQQAISGICEAIEAIEAVSRRLDVKEEQLRNVECAFQEELGRQDESIQDVSLAFMYQSEVLRGLSSYVRALEGLEDDVSKRSFCSITDIDSFDQLSLSTTSLVRRSLVDRARYCIVSMFLETFPNNFKMGGTLPGLDLASTTLTWQIFKRNLNNFYQSFHKQEFLKTGYKLLQIRSCFTHLQSTVNKQVFAPSQGRSEVDEEQTDLVKRELEFFLPIFILEFNHAKKALFDVEEKISSWGLKTCQSETDALEAHPKKNDLADSAELLYPNDSDRFLHGTARSVRARLASTPSVQVRTGAITQRKRGIRRNRDEEDDGDGRMDDPWTASLHTPKTRRISIADHPRNKSSSLTAGEGSSSKGAISADPRDTGNGRSERSRV